MEPDKCGYRGGGMSLKWHRFIQSAVIAIVIVFILVLLIPAFPSPHPVTVTNDRIFRLGKSIQEYYKIHNTPSHHEIINLKYFGKDKPVYHKRWLWDFNAQPINAAGEPQDAWGQTFQIGITTHDQAIGIIIKSFGPNQKDDNGLLDDIIYVNSGCCCDFHEREKAEELLRKSLVKLIWVN